MKSFGTRLLAAIPFQKLKILIVVWQILTQVCIFRDDAGTQQCVGVLQG